MSEVTQGSDPRWGEAARDHKAEAVLATLRLYCQQELCSGTWLDIGCGSGGIAATLATHVERVIGIDPEPWARWESYRGSHPNLTFRIGGYRDLESIVGANSCAVVVCNQVYEHVDDPVALLAVIHRVLRADGICYFAGPNLLWPIEPHVVWPFVHWLPRTFAQRCMRALGSQRAGKLDAWSWSYWRLVRHFRCAGFTHTSVLRERASAAMVDRHPGIAHMVGHLPRVLTTVMSPISPAFVFVLRKSADGVVSHHTPSRVSAR